MNVIPEVVEILTDLQMELGFGHAPSTGLKNILEKKSSPLARAFKIWHLRLSSGQKRQDITAAFPELTKTAARKNLLFVIQKGISGHPISELLSNLEKEFYFVLEQDLERHIQLLPLKLLIPLTLFLLPAVMILLLSPVMNIFQKGF